MKRVAVVYTKDGAWRFTVEDKFVTFELWTPTTEGANGTLYQCYKGLLNEEEQ